MKKGRRTFRILLVLIPAVLGISLYATQDSWKDNSNFFHKGTNKRWQGVLTEKQSAQYQELAKQLYRKHKINPLAGCLPSLVQLPVWWALYTSLSTNIELYHMPFFGWLTDLSAPDPFYILPVCLGLLMHLQQRLSPTSMDPTQAKMMMYFMPIMITVFMLFLPSGLCLYMLTNSALGIGQMRLNEYRLQREVEAAGPIESSDDDDEPEPEAGSDESSSKSQKRRPRRKRRVRRGRA